MEAIEMKTSRRLQLIAPAKQLHSTHAMRSVRADLISPITKTNLCIYKILAGVGFDPRRPSSSFSHQPTCLHMSDQGDPDYCLSRRTNQPSKVFFFAKAPRRLRQEAEKVGRHSLINLASVHGATAYDLEIARPTPPRASRLGISILAILHQLSSFWSSKQS
ncbi:LAQU0S21e00628g1_1 [Lachancea quebecensis]|uniref:LAQU0S21e00628g1_1 n=1 Tax=Lachancea quebecensis TaxID=1654605 RepID=A0A0P1KXQ4_9SACH|nr:LAQU0S21e00628g1_1 [Lachancea quebecensis]